MNMFVVIGLGRFGSSVAMELSDLGHQVLAIDTDEAMVQRMADKVTQAVVADCRDQELLLRIGADKVVFPERQSGRWLARTLDKREILSYVELSERYGIVKIQVPDSWENKTLRELDIRSKYKVNIVAIQSADGGLQTVPDPGYRFRPGDLVFTLGKNESNERLIMG